MAAAVITSFAKSAASSRTADTSYQFGRHTPRPMRRGFLYLVAIMDWASRKVLAWRLSNTMEADFCVAALEEAIARYGRPDIFNTDQGSQFTSFAFTNTLQGRRHPHLHGRPRPLDGQRLHRAAVAIAQIRMRLPQRLRDRQRGKQPGSVVGSATTMPTDRTRPSAAGRPTRSMLSTASRRNWRRNRTQNPP